MSIRVPRWTLQSLLGIALAIGASAVLDLQAQGANPPQAGAKECGPGYTGTPETGCADINECRVNNGECDPLTRCTNTVGGRECGGCPQDFVGDGYLGCKDVNECAMTECKFIDTKAPAIRTSGNATVKATSPDGAVVSYTATAVDNVDGPSGVTCTPASGTVFKVGTTTVTCTSVDKKGNSRSVVLVITVGPPS